MPSSVDLTGVHRRALSELSGALAPGEVIRVAILGEADQSMLGTDMRVFVFKKGYQAGISFRADLTPWDYRDLVGVHLSTGTSGGAVLLEAGRQKGRRRSYWGTADADPFRAPNAIPVVAPFEPAMRGVAELRRLIERAQHPTGPSSAPPAPPPASETGAAAATPEGGAAAAVAQLRQLAELRAAGMLSDEEFQAMKDRIIHGG